MLGLMTLTLMVDDKIWYHVSMYIYRTDTKEENLKTDGNIRISRALKFL